MDSGRGCHNLVLYFSPAATSTTLVLMQTAEPRADRDSRATGKQLLSKIARCGVKIN